VVFLNNCKAFDHAKGYGIADAFFDLAGSGFHATLAVHLSPGETCIVAAKEKDGQIRFTWYSFSRVEIRAYEGVPWRVSAVHPSNLRHCRRAMRFAMGFIQSSLIEAVTSRDTPSLSDSRSSQDRVGTDAAETWLAEALRDESGRPSFVQRPTWGDRRSSASPRPRRPKNGPPHVAPSLVPRMGRRRLIAPVTYSKEAAAVGGGDRAFGLERR
jgi:hypothetical protein